jgi:hypothetical protein
MNANGVPEVFGVNSSGLYEARYVGSTWTAWTSLSGSGGGDVSVVFDSGNGYQYAFVLGSAGTVSVDTYNGTSWSLTSLGYDGSALVSISATLWGSIPEVFGVNSSDVYAAQYGNSTWSWTSVGTVGGDEVSVVFDPGNSYQYAFVLGTSGGLSVDTWNLSSWSSMPLNDDGSPFTSISATLYTGNVPEVFAVNSSGVYLAQYENSTGTWTALGGGGQVVVCGTQQVIVQGTSGAVSLDSETGSVWTGWAGLSVAYSPSSSTIMVGGAPYFFALGPAGGIYYYPLSGTLTYLGDEGPGFTSIFATLYSTTPEVFAVNASGLYAAAYYNSTWNWSLLPGGGGDEVSVVYDSANSYQYAFVLATSGALSVDTWNGSSWTSTSLASLGTGFAIPAMTPVVVGTTPYLFMLSGTSDAYDDVVNSNGTWQGVTAISGAVGLSAIAPVVVGSTPYLFMLGGNGDAYDDIDSSGSWGGVTAISGAAGLTEIAPVVVGTTPYLFMLSGNGDAYDDIDSNGTWGGVTAISGAVGLTGIAPVVVGTNVWLFMLGGNGDAYSDEYSNGSWGGVAQVTGATGVTAISAFAEGGYAGVFIVGPNGQVYVWYDNNLIQLT